MATKKKARRAKTSKAVARKSNPATGKKLWPIAKRFTRRRRNPGPELSFGSIIENVGFAAAGAFATDALTAMVPYNPGGIVSLGIKAGVAYGVGWGVRRFLGVSAKHAELMTVGGMVSVGKDAINDYVLPTINNVIGRNTPVQVAQVAQPARAGLKGFGDIVTLQGGGYDPYWGSTPAGLGDIVTRRPLNY
jgi:hypothetical protein